MTALDRSLTDRARAITTTKGPWVEGEPVEQVAVGEWFPARLRIDVAREGAEPLVKRATLATLLCPAEADLTGADRVEVESETAGTATWEVDGEPLALMRGRRAAAWRARLQRVEP